MKTLALRLEEDLHASLTLLAQVEETTLTELSTRVIERYVADMRSRPEVISKAQALLEEMDREARQRREAVQALLQAPTTTGEDPPTGKGGRKSSSTES